VTPVKHSTGSTRPASIAASSKDGNFIEPERLPSMPCPPPPCFRGVVKGVARRRLQSLRVWGRSYYRLDSSVRTARRTSTPHRSSLASGRSRRSSTPSTIHEHDRDLSNPIDSHPEVTLVMPFWVASPFQGPTSRASLVQGLEYGFRRFEHPSLRLLASRLVTPTRVARTPLVVSS